MSGGLARLPVTLLALLLGVAPRAVLAQVPAAKPPAARPSTKPAPQDTTKRAPAPTPQSSGAGCSRRSTKYRRAASSARFMRCRATSKNAT